MSENSPTPADTSQNKSTIPRSNFAPVVRKEIAALIASGVFALFVTLVISALQIAGVISMGVAHLLLFFAWFVVVVAVFTSEKLLSRSPKHTLVVGSLTAIILGGAVWRVDVWMVNKRAEQGTTAAQQQSPPPELHGLLIPANEPDPPNPCSELPPGVVKVFLGSSLGYTKKKQVVIQLQNQELVSIAISDNQLALSARVFSADNKVVGQITNNEFYINPSNYFHLTRPDWHTLIVSDGGGRQLLFVRYLNPSTIKILGVFYNPALNDSIVIGEKEQILSIAHRNVMSANCFHDVSSAALAP